MVIQQSKTTLGQLSELFSSLSQDTHVSDQAAVEPNDVRADPCLHGHCQLNDVLLLRSSQLFDGDFLDIESELGMLLLARRKLLLTLTAISVLVMGKSILTTVPKFPSPK